MRDVCSLEVEVLSGRQAASLLWQELWEEVAGLLGCSSRSVSGMVSLPMREQWILEVGLAQMAQALVVSTPGSMALSGWPAPRLWQRLARWRSAAWDLWPVLLTRPARLLVVRWGLFRARK